MTTQLVHTMRWTARPEPKAISIQDAVDMSCTRGAIETAHERADQAVAMMGRLLTVLHSAGTLSDDALLTVLDLGSVTFQEMPE